jgi:hypothetical protein
MRPVLHAAAIAALLVAGNPAEAQEIAAAKSPSAPEAPTFSRAVEAHEFAVKVVCGIQAESGSLQLAEGVYATAVNVRNPHTVDIKFEKFLALTFPPRQQEPGAVHHIASDRLGAGEAVGIDCEDLRNEAFPYGYPEPYIKGFLVVQSPQDLDVVSVSTVATLDRKQGAGAFGSLDVERVPGRRIPVVLSPPTHLPPTGPDVSREDVLCSALAQTSAIVEGTVASITYTFDEAPGEGPREVVKLVDVEVHVGGGGVLEHPIELLLLGGYLPDGDILFVSHMPVMSVGKRYVMFLRNTYWKLSPIVLDFYFRRETVQARQILVDQNGYAVTDIFSGRLRERVYAPELTGEPPALVNDDPDGLERTLAPGGYVDQLITFSETCPGDVLSGVFAQYPVIPWDVIGGSPPDLGIQSP